MKTTGRSYAYYRGDLSAGIRDPSDRPMEDGLQVRVNLSPGL